MDLHTHLTVKHHTKVTNSTSWCSVDSIDACWGISILLLSCLVPMIMNSVLSSFNFNILFSIHCLTPTMHLWIVLATVYQHYLGQYAGIPSRTGDDLHRHGTQCYILLGYQQGVSYKCWTDMDLKMTLVAHHGCEVHILRIGLLHWYTDICLTGVTGTTLVHFHLSPSN